MKVPLSWLKEYVDIDLSLEDLARVLTMVGLEVDEVKVIGLPIPSGEKREFKFTGLSWDPEKFVVAQIDEVMPHPNADRLTLCKLNDGHQDLVVLTGAPNLYPYKGQGPLAKPIKVAYAKEGARLYDGHQPGQVITTLKRAKIRGVDSFSMVCSEKELGISEEHEGIIMLDEDAPTGMPLADYMGDAVYDVSILPNMIRNACVMGVAREIAAVTGKTLRKPVTTVPVDGPSIEGKAFIDITDPELNSRFVVGLIQGVEPRPSPYKVQLRLRLAGMRPINSIVDATNYVMLELGEPLHAFDYDVLVKRANGQAPTIITRAAYPGEVLTTLDGVERKLDPFTIMVTDTAGSLSLAGVMGGMESEVTDATRNVLLEGASWNFINIRKTVSAQKLPSEAGYRFSRNIHPALAKEGVLVGMDRLAAWSGGQISTGLVDVYPKLVVDPEIEITTEDVKRLLGVSLTAEEISGVLSGLEFKCLVDGEKISVKTPPHRMDIGEGVVGKADLMEEIARIYGYDRIPATRLSAELPMQRSNVLYELEEHLRDILASLGLYEVITYRLTAPEREARLDLSPVERNYIRLANPITPERSVMRQSLLASVLEIMEKNTRLSERLAFFEIGPIYLPVEGEELPAEPERLVITLSGLRHQTAWDIKEEAKMDFFDLKGVLEALTDSLHLPAVVFEVGENASLHPGKTALIKSGETLLGVFGELHPQVKERYDLPNTPVLVAELDVMAILKAVQGRHEVQAVPVFPPILEDIAVVVDEEVSAEKIVAAIKQGGGKMLTDVRLFDVFRSEQVGAGKKSMAYALTYQAPDRTLTDVESTQIRQRIIRRLEQEVGGKLRS
jgi:phenylalanyl-tRNA synthetase beta chain